jgi:hypothetical protein
VKTLLRRILAESYVAPIAIAILMGRAVVGAIDGFAIPVGYGIVSSIEFVVVAVGEREMPFIPDRLDIADLLFFSKSISTLESAATCAIAAWVLARLVYGLGPIRSLRMAWPELRGRLNAESLEKSSRR